MFVNINYILTKHKFIILYFSMNRSFNKVFDLEMSKLGFDIVI